MKNKSLKLIYYEKSKKIVYLVFIAMFILVSCEKEDLSVKNQIANEKTENIIIDGIGYDIIFEESLTGETSLKEEVEQNSILIEFIEKNENMISYVDEETETTHLFKGTKEMELFFENENKMLAKKLNLKKIPSFATSQSSSSSSSSSSNDVKTSTLSLYDHTEFNYMMWSGELSFDMNNNSINIPDFRNVLFGSVNGYYNMNDKMRSIKLVSYKLPAPYLVFRSTVRIYRDYNYTSNSFVMSVTTASSQVRSYYDLKKKLMYSSWFKKKYWDNRASSMKYWCEPI